MRVVVWIVEGTWRACVDAAARHSPPGAELTLLHVTDDATPDAAHGAVVGLLGRGHGDEEDLARLSEIAAHAAHRLLTDAAERLDSALQPATGPHATRQLHRHGRPEHEVIATAFDADLLVVARDGDRGHRGPRSLGPASRYVVDHAPCDVLLVWPETIPATPDGPPPKPHEHSGPPHHPRRHRHLRP